MPPAKKIMEPNEFPEIEREQKSSVKVTHNSKGYNWEVKVYNEDPDKIFDKVIELETKCAEKYGNGRD